MMQPMNETMKRLLPVILGLGVLGGCAIIRQAPPTEPGVVDAVAWQTRQAELADLGTWSLQGRVATGKLLGWTGNLSWRQQGPHFDVRLSGPLGAGGMRADGALPRVRVRTRNRNIVTDQPDALVRQTLGFSFPLQPLRYWAKGVPAPGDYQRIAVSATGRLQSLRQDGWRVSYLDYTQPSAQAPALPRRIVLDNGDTRIRLVVDRWFDIDEPGEAVDAAPLPLPSLAGPLDH